jgi:hypothetical protein
VTLITLCSKEAAHPCHGKLSTFHDYAYLTAAELLLLLHLLTLATTTCRFGTYVFLWAFNQGRTQSNWTVKHFYNVFRHIHLENH